MSTRNELIADLLMGAAFADSRLDGREYAAVKKLLAEVVGEETLPDEMEARLKEFDPKTFDPDAVAKGLELEGDDEKLKFEACFPLMRDFHDPRALSYLLAQVGSSDWKRAKTAIYWVGDASNSGKPVTPEILEKVGPLLESRDADRRRAAVHAVGTWRGAEVVKRLIPVLADENAIVAREAAWRLSKQADRKALKKLLAEAAEKNESEKVRAKAAEILKGLKAEE